MKKGALLHFDYEFTHPVPGTGQPMAMAIVAEEARFEDDGSIVVLEGIQQYQSIEPVNGMAHVVDWVQQNQAELLDKCRKFHGGGSTWARSCEQLVRFLRGVSKEFGEHLVPVGWCIGSDVAYLLSMLREDCHMVHYEGLDIAGMLYGKFGRTIDSAEIHELLGVPDNDDPHNPLADVQYQRALFHAVREH